MRRCVPLLVIQALAQCAVVHTAEVDISAASLAGNDECGDGGEQCAVSALQTKGILLTNSSLEDGYNPEEPALDKDAKTLGASVDMDVAVDEVSQEDMAIDASNIALGSSRLQHYGQNCWYACGKSSGFCNWCGYGNACCRWSRGGPPECQHVKWWPVVHMHTCVKTRYNQGSGLPPAPPMPVPAGSNIKTLYHLTSPQIARSIVGGGFRTGSGGWCGAAIYMIDHPNLPKTKFNPKTTKTGAWIEAKVNMGKICRMQKTCHDGRSGKCCKAPNGGLGTAGAQSEGCSSIVWNPGDGDEYIIWNPSQVVSKRIYNCFGAGC